MAELIDDIERYYQQTNQPCLDGEPSVTAVMLAAYLAGANCPGFETGLQGLVNMVGQAAAVSAAKGFQNRGQA